MKKLVSRIPLPVTALALGWIILGNIFVETVPFLGDISMIIGIMLLCGIIAKICLFPIEFYRNLKSPVGLSVFSCFPIALIMLAPWLKSILGDLNNYVWGIAVIMQTILLVIFTVKYVIIGFRLKYVFPSWLLIYYGLGFAALTSEQFGMIIFGMATFRALEVLTFIIIPIILFKMYQKQGTGASKPLTSLIVLPSAILLITYINVADKIDLSKIFYLFVITQILLVISIAIMIFRMVDGYYPSWSSYVVAVAMATYSSQAYKNYIFAHKVGFALAEYIVFAELLISVIVAVFILLVYFANIMENPVKQKQKMAMNMTKSNERREKRKKMRMEITQKLNLGALKKADEEYKKEKSIGLGKDDSSVEKLEPILDVRENNKSSEKNIDEKTAVDTSKKEVTETKRKRSNGNLLKDLENIDELID